MIKRWGVQILVCLAALLCALAGPAFANELASISGRITDSQGLVLPAVKVEAVNINTNVAYSGESNGDGLYRIPSVPPGVYRIIVQKNGFSQIVKPNVELHVQDDVALNFGMQVGSVSQTVTVEGGAPMINTTGAAVGTVVDQTYIKNMPLNGRSFQDLILLAPGVVTQTTQLNSTTVGVGKTGEFSVNGQRTESNYYTVDGVSANTSIGGTTGGCLALGWSAASGSVAASTALGTTQALVSVDELQEFRVQTSSYSAEYGRNPGAQIAFETKSGVNQWHGTAYDYLRNDFFDANDYFNDYLRAVDPTLTKPALRQNDFGGTLGGPVRIPGAYNGRDKTFFFVSYEGLRLLQPQPASTMAVPDNALRTNTPAPLNQVLKAFPVPNGPELLFQCDPASDPNCPASGQEQSGAAQFVASWSNPSSINATSARFDHVVNDKLKLFFRFSNTLSNQTALGVGGGTPSMSSALSYTARTYTGGASTVFSSRLSNELRLNYTSNAEATTDAIHAFGGSTPVDLAKLTGLGPSALIDPIFSLGNGSYFFGIDRTVDASTQRQWNLVDTVNYSLGRHQLKFGADYRRLTPFAVPHNPNLLYAFLDENSVLNNSGLVLSSSNAPGYPLIQNFSLFAQDEWKVSPRLSLSLGLRWEVNPAAGATQGTKPSTILFVGGSPDTWQLAPQGTPLWQTAWYNFAPRLGAAYVMRDKQGWETVVRGGGGVFFDTGQQLGTLSFTGPGFFQQGSINFSPFPGDPAALAPPISNPPAGPFSAVYGYATHLQLPYTLQWNASIEQALGASQSFTISYIGAHASRLLQQNSFQSSVDANGDPVNPVSGTFVVVQNGQTSDYHAMQTQFQRRLSRGLTALASYTWSHCLDYGSVNYTFGYERGNCGTDVRHSFSAAFSYDLPNLGHSGIASAVLHHWGLDDRFIARTAFPVDLTGGTIFDPNTDRRLSSGLNLVSGPIYLYGDQCAQAYGPGLGGTGFLQAGQGCPGGRGINPNAFQDVTTGLGNVPRNFARGFGAWQMNLGVRREFPIYEGLKLQFRAEAFNVFNHPNFGTINGGHGQGNFGLATGTLANSLGVLSPLYQMGGPRSMQFALKIVF